mmetsp:Transcript_82890/g.239484  ORF Transcript_82890/g.239484 Transcript_82890/m.239484 type:complete len:293 (+) Transcript_82890:2072-2950(+)
MQLREGLRQQGVLVDGVAGPNGAVRHQGAVGAPHREQVFMLVPRAVHLEVELLDQLLEQGGGRGGKLFRAGEVSQARVLQPFGVQGLPKLLLRAAPVCRRCHGRQVDQRARPGGRVRRALALQRLVELALDAPKLLPETLGLRAVDGLLDAAPEAQEAGAATHQAEHEDDHPDRSAQQDHVLEPAGVEAIGRLDQHAALHTLRHLRAPCVDGEVGRMLILPLVDGVHGLFAEFLRPRRPPPLQHRPSRVVGDQAPERPEPSLVPELLEVDHRVGRVPDLLAILRDQSQQVVR